MYNSPDLNNITELPVLEYQEYYLIKDNSIHKVTIMKNENEITIKVNNYIYKFNSVNISILSIKEIITIYKAYIFINSLFEENKITIKDIIINKKLVLNFKINDEKNIEIILSYNRNNNNFILNEINKLRNEIKELKKQNNQFRKEIDILKSYHNNPKNFKLLTDVDKDSYACTNLDNIFTIFKSVNDVLMLIYSNKNKSLISYDLNNQKLITEIKNCHDKYISNLRHCLDKKNKRDLVMSLSFKDNNIKLWDANNWNCILNISEVNKNGFLDSACFLEDNNQYFIVTSNCNWSGYSEPIKIMDFNGNKIKEISNSNDKTYFIDTYYDKVTSTNYIITGNENYVKSYDYNENKLYYKYYDNDNRGHFSIVINEGENILELIESCFDGNIRIWNFHYGILLNKIKIINYALFGICLWKTNYLLVGCEDKSIKLIELKNGLLIQNLAGHKKWVISIKKINHPKLGECIISKGYDNDQIKIWSNKK